MNNPLSSLQHRIALEQAVEMTTRYRAHKEQVIREEYAGRNILPISETFNRAAIDRLLAQPGCAGLRLYYSMSEDLRLHAILVGVNEQEQPILSATGDPDETEGEILEVSKLCPPLCEGPSPLNP